MPFAKIKTDVFANSKIRRISDGSFRIWIYMLTQAWEESPNKRAGTVSFRGVLVKGEGQDVRERLGNLLYHAAGCTENEGLVALRYAGFVNELENVGLIHCEETEAGTSVSQGVGVGTPGTFWDITISMHDWDYHNPRVPPSHTTEGEADRKRKYRAKLKEQREQSQD